MNRSFEDDVSSLDFAIHYYQYFVSESTLSQLGSILLLKRGFDVIA